VPPVKVNGKSRPSGGTARSGPGVRASRVGGKAAVGTKPPLSQRAAGDRGARTGNTSRPAPAKPARSTKPLAKSAPGDQRTGGARRARGKSAGGKRGTACRSAVDAPRAAGQKGRHRENKPKAFRAKLVGVSPRTVILLILLVIFIVLAISPVTGNLEATGRLRKINDELKKEKAVTDSLEKEVSEARSIEYVEREARKQRMVAPGEILYLVTAGSSESEVKYRVKALQSMEEAWERVRQMLHSVPRQK